MSDGNIVFAGQIGRAQTQVFGITDKRDVDKIQRAQTFGIGQQPPSNSMSNFTNPKRDQRDIQLQQMQQSHQNNGIQVHMPVSQRISQRPTQLADGTMANNEKLFKELKGIGRIGCFAFSVIVSLLFTYISFAVFTSFDNTKCTNNCDFSKISNDVIQHKVSKHGLTIMTDECYQDGFYLLYRYNATNTGNNGNDLTKMSYDDLHDLYQKDLLLTDLFITQINDIGSSCVTSSSRNFNGYTIINKKNTNDNIWFEDTSWSGIWVAVSWLYMIFILCTEWLFWSYSTEFTKKTDNLAMFMWGLLRFGNYSFMFSISLAYSLIVSKNNVSFLIGDYSNIAVQMSVITSLIGLTVPIALVVLFSLCLCLAVCCSETESNNCADCGCSLREFHDSCCSPCGEWFIPFSRFKRNNLVNDNEQCVGDAMCYFMIFGAVLVIAGVITFIGFMTVLFNGSYFHDGSAAGLYFALLIISILETVWFWTYDDGTKDDNNRSRVQSN